jgi:3-deoxy-D-manno-octulosonic-acid transferase
VFDDYTLIGMQSELDRQRIEAIGASPSKVSVVGNLKYDAVISSRRVDSALASVLGNWTPLWIAASTMPGEEAMILDAFHETLRTHPTLKLLIAPRHPNRFDAVAEMIQAKGMSMMRRTQLTTVDTNILLLDTIGELAMLFQYATVVYMGGTLVPTGGHNVLEPARHSKPIVFGPHMENFRDIARLFLEAKAAIQIQQSSQLAPAISGLLSNPRQAAELSRNALSIVDQNSGATERALQLLAPLEIALGPGR